MKGNVVNMNTYQIITDSGCDLPRSMVEELGLHVIPLGLSFRGNQAVDSVDHGIKELYEALRNGESATTSAVNPGTWTAEIEPFLKDGRDTLVLVFSSALSSTYQSARIAAEQLAVKYPERKIKVIDTLCASLGQGLFVWYACKKRDEGMDMDSLVVWLEAMKPHMCHLFTVNDLMFLKRGGRISAASAIAGTALNIKPMLHVDDDGYLVVQKKVRGRKASLDYMVDRIAEIGWNDQNDAIFISHGDCVEDAEYLKEKIEERLGKNVTLIGYIGAVIGSHSGPGTLALFFLAEKR